MGAMDEAFTPTQQDILAALFNAVNVVSGHAARQSDGGHTMLGSQKISARVVQKTRALRDAVSAYSDLGGTLTHVSGHVGAVG